MKQKSKAVLLAAVLVMILGVLTGSSAAAASREVPIRGTGVIGQEQTEVVPEEPDPEEQKPPESKTGTGTVVKTGDSSNVFLWSARLAFSVFLMISAVSVKHRGYQNKEGR